MFEIVIQVKDKSKSQLLQEILQTLGFVEVMQVRQVPQEQPVIFQQAVDADFFAFAGIWSDRQPTLSSLRNKAWPQR